MSLPNLLVIGAMKCGTTSLHHYLGLHPEVFMSRHKELDFFVEDLNWKRGPDWYSEQFPTTAPVRGEASPRYTLHPAHPGVPGRIRALIPDARLLYVVRDPVERLLSHYRHDVIEGSEDRPLEQILEEDDERSRYVRCGRYSMQLREYRPFFSPRQILVIRQEDLRSRRRATLGAVFRFLGVDDSFASWRTAIERHRTVRKRRPTELGRALRAGVLRRVLDPLPGGLRGQLEWLAMLPFSRAVRPYEPTAAFRARLEDRFRGEMEALEREWEVARPAIGERARAPRPEASDVGRG